MRMLPAHIMTPRRHLPCVQCLSMLTTSSFPHHDDVASQAVMRMSSYDVVYNAALACSPLPCYGMMIYLYAMCHSSTCCVYESTSAERQSLLSKNLMCDPKSERLLQGFAINCHVIQDVRSNPCDQQLASGQHRGKVPLRIISQIASANADR
jgi:hypothetical protein